MPRRIRLYEPDVVYEIISRTVQGRFLLLPSRWANELIVGVIGRAMELYPTVRVHGVVFLSNHATWLISAGNPSEIPEFMGHVNRNISKEVGDLYSWEGSMWDRPFTPIPVVDEWSMIRKMKYLLAQGCKEGLVASPLDWPGVTSVHAMLGIGKLRGTWFWRDKETRARRRKTLKRRLDVYDFATEYEISLSPLPCWAHLDADAYAREIQALVSLIEKETLAAYPLDRNPVMGAKKVMRFHPHYCPAPLERTPAPLCHAATEENYQAYRTKYRAFVDAFRRACAGIAGAVFPLYSYPPRRPMVLSSA